MRVLFVPLKTKLEEFILVASSAGELLRFKELFYMMKLVFKDTGVVVVLLVYV